MSLKSALKSTLRDQKDNLMIAAQDWLIIPCRFVAATVYHRFRRHRTSSPTEIDWSKEFPKKDFMTKPYSEWTNKDKTECFMARYDRFGTGGL